MNELSYGVDGISTSNTKKDEALTMDMVKEAGELIKALAPKKAPDDVFVVTGVTGLRIMKNAVLPENTVVVSKTLFDMIYAGSSK